MRTIKNKLNSERGASLTFALLLFLVCAVVGSAVLVAGTAASGRMSRIAEMDQRYYSVNSAARLLIELIEKNEIWVEAGEEGTGKSYKLYIETEEVGPTETSLALDLARRALEMSGDRETVTLSLEPPDNLGANLAVKAKETISSNGDVTFAVSNADDSAKYTITLYFMNVGGASSFKWVLYDIDSKMPIES